ncbi:HD domain-containing phosphohydrolase [uncultured Thiodictyon sp.]|uniref:HD domain-containing phosphohydrolase n=1 Tax=uncultured Thiodictyon sp. TaxID=1846217 RepID=UPI0025D56E99|nr:HD domain-containing phosphohydrolase [uncultured Thiodictyon sp.]
MNPLLATDKAHIAVVDDQVENLQLLVSLLAPHYHVHPFTGGDALLRYLRGGLPADLILLDVVMPPPDGHEVCRQMRALGELDEVPIVFLTALDSMEDEARGLALGAVDYITKPFSPSIVLARVKNHVNLSRAMRLIHRQNEVLESQVAERTAELLGKNADLRVALRQIALSQDVTIVALTSLAEARDQETGQHIQRTQNYVRELALAVRTHPLYAAALDDQAIELLFKSAPLHDIGKVAIPDSILLKAGPLTPEEFEIMKSHTEHGRSAIQAAEDTLGGGNSFLRYAREIVYSHHEQWDGSGYPLGLCGEAIPLAGRLMALADVYDALISRRVYKPPMAHDQAVSIIAAKRGTHFDPALVDAFLTIQGRFAEIAQRYSDG